MQAYPYPAQAPATNPPDWWASGRHYLITTLVTRYEIKKYLR